MTQTFSKKLLLSLLGFGAFVFHGVAHAQANQQTVDTQKTLVQKMDAQIGAEEKTIQELKNEISVLRNTQQKQAVEIKHAVATQNSSTDASSEATSSETVTKKHKDGHLLDVGAMPVVTSPYLGLPSRWDAMDLVVNQPTYDEDVILMQRKHQIDHGLRSYGYGHATNPILELSGKVEAQAWAAKPMTGRSQSMIDLSGAEVDFVTHVNDWVNGIVAMVYDNSPPNANGSTNAQLVTNSRVYVDHAFITIGRLSRSPYYLTIGQRSVPYGHYVSYMISNTYPQQIFKTRDRAILVGYSPLNNVGPYANAFVFKGDTKSGGGQNNINNFGSDVGILFDNRKVSGDVGISGILNVADSLGMQNNGITDPTQFRGFGFGPNGQPAENMVRKVPGINLHTNFSWNKWTLIAEGNTATSRFSAQDMNFNAHGAKPAAVHSELVYAFNVANRPTSWAIGYDHSWQALSLMLPQARYITTVTTSFYKDTIESLEFKREINYPNAVAAGGQGVSVIHSGHFANTVTAQIGYYF